MLEAADGAEVWAVIKANAYGHGAVDVGRAARAAGATKLCTATLAEARAVRDALPDVPLLVLSPLTAGEESDVAAVGCAVTVSTPEGWQRLRDRHDIDVHVKVETGMGRWGLAPADALEVGRALINGPRPERLVGLMSHLATAPPPSPPLSAADAHTNKAQFKATARMHANAEFVSLISPQSLELAFRIAGVTADTALHAAALAEFHLQSRRLTEKQYNNVVNAAICGLKDWHESGRCGPSPPPTTATEYFPISGDGDHQLVTPAQRWVEGHRQISALLATLPTHAHARATLGTSGTKTGRASASASASMDLAVERVRRASVRLFMAALKESAQRVRACLPSCVGLTPFLWILCSVFCRLYTVLCVRCVVGACVCFCRVRCTN